MKPKGRVLYFIFGIFILPYVKYSLKINEFPVTLKTQNLIEYIKIKMHHRETVQCIRSQSWSTPSGSPSPPPPPLPPPVVTRWARTERASAEACPHCRGQIASFPTRTTSLSSYSMCKDRNTPVARLPEDEDSFPVLCDRELHSLHRNIPALRRRDVDTNTIKQHYYPEGGWGWLVCGAAFLANLLTSGFQLAFGLLYLYVMKFLVKPHENKEFYLMATAWMGAMCLSISLFVSPFVVAISRRKSTRLTAVLGGIILALSCLFTSFAGQFHQALLSYGIVLGAGAGLVREASGLVLGHYFRKRREFVEMVAQSGSGIGIALFSVFFKEAVGKLGWRLGLYSATCVLALAFFLPIVYRSANLYHPQRRAIMHLKNQRKKMKEKKTHAKGKKPPMFDFTPLKSKGLRVILVASATGSLGVYSPIFYLALQGHEEGLKDSALVLLQTFLGFATALGFVGFGLIIVRPNTQCLISRRYLCQTSLVGIGISLLALSAVQGYHGYVLFVWLYGICLGGFCYSLKMFTLERIRARHFTKAWSFVQGAKSVPVLIGIPITGYMNQLYPKAGYYFSFGTTIVSASLMFLVGRRKEPNNGGYGYNVKMNECICNFNSPYVTEVPFNVYRPPPVNQYEQFVPSYDHFDRNSICRHSSVKYARTPTRQYHLPKSSSCAANIHHPSMMSLNRSPSVCQYRHARGNLRATRSVPEGLARYTHYGSCRRPIVRDVHLIEQITTSV